LRKWPESTDTLRCSFCHKSQSDAGKLIAAPSGYPRAYICDECIAVCNSVIEDDREDMPAPNGREDLHLLLDRIPEDNVSTVRKMLLDLIPPE
jgi:ATP-dependent protease Clp ATPase subunit